MEQQNAPMEQQSAADTEIEIELIGALEDVSRGWGGGNVADFWDGDWDD